MGIYATTTSLETYWGGASFSGLTAQSSLLITQAENEVNKYLAKRYDIAPFQTTVPPMVQTLTEWLSLGYLYENTARGSENTYQRADRYIKKAMDNLMDIADHKADLVSSSGEVIAEAALGLQILSTSTDYHSTFNEDDPLNWSVDQDKVDDIVTERS